MAMQAHEIEDLIRLAFPDAKISIIGKVKDAVLPVPVCADPSISRPIKTDGIEAA